jgi:hypothetical protein
VRILLVKVVVPLTSFLQLSCFGSFEDDLSPAFLVKVLSHAEYERTLRDTMKKSHISNSFLMCTLLLFWTNSFKVVGVEGRGRGFRLLVIKALRTYKKKNLIL